MAKRRAAALLVLLVARGAGAQDAAPIRDRSLHWQPYAVAVGGQAADVWATRRKLGQGCAERNVGAFGAQPSAWRLVAGKAPVLVLSVLATAVLQRSGHQTAARWVGGSVGAVGFAAAGYNLSVDCVAR